MAREWKDLQTIQPRLDEADQRGWLARLLVPRQGSAWDWLFDLAGLSGTNLRGFLLGPGILLAIMLIGELLDVTVAKGGLETIGGTTILFIYTFSLIRARRRSSRRASATEDRRARFIYMPPWVWGIGWTVVGIAKLSMSHQPDV